MFLLWFRFVIVFYSKVVIIGWSINIFFVVLFVFKLLLGVLLFVDIFIFSLN